jgi:hypothetical protein
VVEELVVVAGVGDEELSEGVSVGGAGDVVGSAMKAKRLERAGPVDCRGVGKGATSLGKMWRKAGRRQRERLIEPRPWKENLTLS